MFFTMVSKVLFKFLVCCHKIAKGINNLKELSRYFLIAIICVTYVLRHLVCYVGISISERYTVSF
jgi:hypothetical protein